MTAAAPRGVPLPVDIQARKPENPERTTPKKGTKTPRIAKKREEIPNVIIMMKSHPYY